MKPFLQPLTVGEEAFYCKLLREGTEEEKKNAKERLIEHNMRLVAHIAKKYQTSHLDQEELISVGTVGLMKAILSFDPEKGNKLGTYAARCIENELLMLLRARRKVDREVSLQEPVGMDQDGNELHLMDVIESTHIDIVETMEQREQTRKMLALLDEVLTPRERCVIVYRYGLDNHTVTAQKDIGKRLGISRSYVSRIEKKALQKLRKKLLEPTSEYVRYEGGSYDRYSRGVEGSK